MLDYVWAASLAVRALAVIIGWRRASREWLIWSVFYLAAGAVLRVIDILRWYGPHGWYVNVWITQQIISTGLLVFVVREAVKPAATLVITSSMAAILAELLTAQVHHWPNSSVETVMAICGSACLAMGIISAIGAGTRRTMHAAILAIFLLGYALLSLAGADYLKGPQIGIAWSLLEIMGFGGWAVVFSLAL